MMKPCHWAALQRLASLRGLSFSLEDKWQDSLRNRRIVAVFGPAFRRRVCAESRFR